MDNTVTADELKSKTLHSKTPGELCKLVSACGINAEGLLIGVLTSLTGQSKQRLLSVLREDMVILKQTLQLDAQQIKLFEE